MPDTIIDVDEIATPQDNPSQDNPSQDNSTQESKEVLVALKNLRDAMKQPTLTNEDLGYIVNGREGELVKDRPFDFTMTKERIMKCNARVGFVPFTRACLKNKHVRHELGQREVNQELEEVNNEYHQAKKHLKDEGFRVDGIFDASITTATTIKRKEREDIQAKELLKKKGAFSASSIFTNIGTMCVSSTSIT